MITFIITVIAYVFWIAVLIGGFCMPVIFIMMIIEIFRDISKGKPISSSGYPDVIKKALRH